MTDIVTDALRFIGIWGRAFLASLCIVVIFQSYQHLHPDADTTLKSFSAVSLLVVLVWSLGYSKGHKDSTLPALEKLDIDHAAYTRGVAAGKKETAQVELNARDSHWMYALETAKQDAVAITPELAHVYSFARQAVKHYQSPGNFTAPWTTSVKRKPRRKKRNRQSTGGPF